MEKLKAPSHSVAGTSTNSLTDDEIETQRGAANREDSSSVKHDTFKIPFGGRELFKKRNAEFKFKMPMARIIPANWLRMQWREKLQ